jgi:hypothetical protein
MFHAIFFFFLVVLRKRKAETQKSGIENLFFTYLFTFLYVEDCQSNDEEESSKYLQIASMTGITLRLNIGSLKKKRLVQISFILRIFDS